MGRILLKDAKLNDRMVDILVEGNRIVRIADHIDDVVAQTIDCNGMYAVPGLINMHTHSAMTLVRGLCEDSPLKVWLDRIWSVEAFLDHEAVYWGTKLAILEMIKSGTTCFLDMYWMADTASKAVLEMGMRAVLTYNFLDNFKEETAQEQKKACARLYELSKSWPDRIRFATSIHADYTTSEETMQYAKRFADEHGCICTAHLCETSQEVEEDVSRYGMRPVAHFEKLGLLDSNMIFAHGVWLDDSEVELLGKRGVTVVHNINSNLKLASGYRFRYQELRDAGVNVCLGTDGAASSNNLDMREAMKTMAMLQKAWRVDPKAMPVDELFRVATVNGAKALGIDAGRIEEGALADIVLIDTKNPEFHPNYNFLGNLIYSANSSCVNTVLIDGHVVMLDRKVEGEDEILENADRVAWKLMKLSKNI